jgi:hypothetical protein
MSYEMPIERPFDASSIRSGLPGFLDGIVKTVASRKNA